MKDFEPMYHELTNESHIRRNFISLLNNELINLFGIFNLYHPNEQPIMVELFQNLIDTLTNNRLDFLYYYKIKSIYLIYNKFIIQIIKRILEIWKVDNQDYSINDSIIYISTNIVASEDKHQIDDHILLSLIDNMSNIFVILNDLDNNII